MTPASIRNRNPGAMEPGPSSRKFGSTAYETLRWRGPKGEPRTNRIATFPTDQHGAAALFDLLHRKYTGKTLQDAITTWCGGYWAGEYGRAVERACGMTGSQILTREAVRDPNVAIPIARAMARQEAGREYPMDAAGWELAHSMAFGGSLAPAPNPENDVPFQKPEGRAREAASDAAPTVATTATAATVAGSSIVPGVPETVTGALSGISSWQAVGDTVVSLVKWGVASPAALAVMLAAIGLIALPKLVRH